MPKRTLSTMKVCQCGYCVEPTEFTYPMRIRIRTDDNSRSTVAILENPDYRIRFANNYSVVGFDKATDYAYKSMALGRRRMSGWSIQEWTINVLGLGSISLGKCEVSNFRTGSSRHPPVANFMPFCTDSLPECDIQTNEARRLIGPEVRQMLLRKYRPHRAQPSSSCGESSICSGSSRSKKAQTCESSSSRSKKAKKCESSVVSISNKTKECKITHHTDSGDAVSDDDDDDDDDDEDFIPVCTWDTRAPAEEWTPENVRSFLIAHRTRAPILKEIVEVKQHVNADVGIGNPYMRVRFVHPTTYEEICVRLGSATLYTVPQYHPKLDAALQKDAALREMTN